MYILEFDTLYSMKREITTSYLSFFIGIAAVVVAAARTQFIDCNWYMSIHI